MARGRDGSPGPPVVYLFTFQDTAGATIERQAQRCWSDVRAVVRAVQMIRDHPHWDSVEVRGVNERLVRRVARREVA